MTDLFICGQVKRLQDCLSLNVCNSCKKGPKSGYFGLIYFLKKAAPLELQRLSLFGNLYKVKPGLLTAAFGAGIEESRGRLCGIIGRRLVVTVTTLNAVGKIESIFKF